MSKTRIIRGFQNPGTWSSEVLRLADM